MIVNKIKMIKMIMKSLFSILLRRNKKTKTNGLILQKQLKSRMKNGINVNNFI